MKYDELPTTLQNLIGEKVSEISELEKAVDKFAVAMKARLRSKSKQGWRGWEHMGREHLGGRLLINAAKGATKHDQKSLIDVANLAMMIHHHDA